MSKPTEKVIIERKDKCPYCSKLIHTRFVRVTTTPAVKGVSVEKFLMEKDTQTTLEQDYTDEYSPPKKKVKRKAY